MILVLVVSLPLWCLSLGGGVLHPAALVFMTFEAADGGEMLEPAHIFHLSRQERGAPTLKPAHVELLNLRRRSCEPTPEDPLQISIILFCTVRLSRWR